MWCNGSTRALETKLLMDYTQSKGNIVELKCITKFIEMGYECSIPYGNGAKYDFVVDVNGELLRIQCKASRNPSRNGKVDYNAFMFDTTSQTTNTKKTTSHRYTKDMIDYFATIYKDKVYIVPVDECSTTKTLRLAPPDNSNNEKCYNKAEDYEIEKYFIHLFKDNYENKVEKEVETYLCIDCGLNTVHEKGRRCKQCADKKQRVVERPTREELKELIRTKPFVQIGEQFGVTDNAVRKWCDSYDLPRRSSDIKKISDNDWVKI